MNLWFAKNQYDNLVTIDDINDENKKNTYSCPMCSSSVIPKATKSIKVTPYFAHVDVSKCNSETMIHFWFKNKFLERGNSFTVISDKERHYICKEVLVEESYEAADKIYRPDVTVLTECGNIIYFEMDYSNKKKIEDYLDIWLDLKNIVVEVDIKKLMDKDKVPTFKALFYEGKCFNTKKNDLYYNTIGKYKEEKFKCGTWDNELKERIKRLDWFWNDVIKYKKGEVNIEQIVNLLDSIEDKSEKELIHVILNKPKCIDIIKDCIEYKTDKEYDLIISKISKKYDQYNPEHIEKVVEYDRSFKQYFGKIKVRNIQFIHHEGLLHSYILVGYNMKINQDVFKKVSKTIRNNIKYIQNKAIIDSYNSKAAAIANSILDNQMFINYKSLISDKKYDVDVYVSTMREDEVLDFNKAEYDLESFDLQFYLECKKGTVDILTIDNIGLDANIDGLCQLMTSRFEQYLEDKKPLDKIEEFENITKLLQSKYSCYELAFYGEHWIDDIYQIRVSSKSYKYLDDIDLEYYVTSEGIVTKGSIINNDSRQLVFESQNFADISTHLLDEINNQIQTELTKRCTDCTKRFTMQLGELEFFIKKDFDLPRRCKECRKNKKNQNKN